MTQSPRARSRLRDNRAVIMLVLGGWVLLSAIVASQNYAEYLLTGSRVSFSLQFAWLLAILSYWVLAVPFVVAVYRRFPLERGHLSLRIPLHIGLASAITLAHAPLIMAVTAAMQPFPLPEDMNFWRALGFTITYSFNTDFLLYWIVVGTAAAHASYQRAREKQLQSAQLQAKLSQARLQALEAQIHPHFLFNALNTVSMLIRENDNDRAVEMIAQLGELLRECLRSAPGHEVALSREIKLTDLYLHVEQCRFADRLRVEKDIPADLEHAMVPHLVLQPLVENAVRHGVSRSSRPGALRIAATRMDQQLMLEVQDNGPDGRRDESRETRSGGIGLENVRSRLEQLYGPAGHLKLERSADGTVARIRLPLRFDEQASSRSE